MTSPVDTSVKFYSSTMAGAPVLNGTAGAQIAMLDAVLVNGFGLKSADSLVVAGGVATISVSTGHSAVVDSVILVAGATTSDLNGEQRVVSIGTNTVSFATAVSNQTATGSITFKIAAAGWSKPFAGTNLAVFKQLDVTSSGMCIRVDDTNAKWSRVVGYESMSDVNAGTNPFPTTAQISGGLWAAKSTTADSTARPWFAFSDGKTFYVMKCTNPSYPQHYNTMSFGDIASVKSGDAYGCFIQSSASDDSSTYQQTDQLMRFNLGAAAGFYMSRSHTGLGGAITLMRTCPTINSTTDYFSGDTGSLSTIQYPNLSDGGLYVAPVLVSENTNGVFRGSMRGVWGVPQRVPANTFAADNVVSGVSGLPGKKLKAMTVGPSVGQGGVYFIDVTGPWG